jgi:xylulokinase
VTTARYVLAHDLGTTGDKASLYDGSGRLVARNLSAYATEYAHPHWAEQDPEDWWRAVCDSTRALLADAEVAGRDVACVAFSGQMMGCVALDAKARPLRTALIWADQRALEQQRALAERIAPERVYRITGHRLSSSYSLCKLLWLRDHDPDVYRAAHAFVNAKDAIVARLTGVFATDHSDASGTNLMDLEALAYSDAILEAAELDPERLPALTTSTTVVGGVLAAVADEIGLPAGVPVVIGGGDGSCAALGAGVWREGAAYNYVGSSSWIALASERPVYDPDERTFTWAHVVPGMYSPCGTMQAAGASYAWARDVLGGAEVERSAREGGSVYERLNALAAGAPAGSRGLVYLPYLLGERSPRWNPNARGAFVGLTVRHGRAELVRAVLEGVTMNLRVILEALTRQGIAVGSVRVIGGGAAGRFWNQMMADMYGLPIERLTHLEEATSMGAAVVGGVAVGLYDDVSIVDRMNPVAEVVEPDEATRRAYQPSFAIFEETYAALVPAFERLAERS